MSEQALTKKDSATLTALVRRSVRRASRCRAPANRRCRLCEGRVRVLMPRIVAALEGDPQ
jgi:hypothetical protein